MRIKNLYQIRFVLVALTFILLGWLLGQSPSEDMKFVYWVAIVLVGIGLMKYLLKLANYVPNQVNYFLHSLLCHDYMIHFPATKDTKLGMMYENMNRIIAQYRNSLLDIEYKQQYYNRLLRIMTH